MCFLDLREERAALPRPFHLLHASLPVFRTAAVSDLALCASTVPTPPHLGPLVVAPFQWPGDSSGNASTFSKLDVFSTLPCLIPVGVSPNPPTFSAGNVYSRSMPVPSASHLPDIHYRGSRNLSFILTALMKVLTALRANIKGLLDLSLSLKSCLACSLSQLLATFPDFYLLLIPLPKLHPRKLCCYVLSVLQRPCKTTLI